MIWNALAIAAAAASAEDPAYEAAAALRRNGDAAGAAAAFERLSAERPGDPDVWLNLGLSYSALGRSDDAERALATAVRLAPAYGDAGVAYARLAFFRGDLDEARRRLAPFLRDGANEEARALRDQIEAASAASGPARLQTPWRLDAFVSYSDLTKGLAPWRSASLALGRSFEDGGSLSAAVEQTERFDTEDTYLEARGARRLGAWSGYLGFGGSPDADYRPEVAVLGGLAAPRIPLAGQWGLEVAVDASWQRFQVGPVRSLQPFATLSYGDRVAVTVRSINTWDERDDFRAGYGVRLAVSATSRFRLGAGWTAAPESSAGVTMRVRAASGTLAYDVSDRTALRLDVTHEDRPFYDRNEVSIGLTRRF